MGTPKNTTAPANTPATVAAMDPAELMPWSVVDFRLDAGNKSYPRKDGTASLRIAQVICKLKGSHDACPFYFLANINRITIPNQKPHFQITLPANMKGAGSYAEAILKTDSPTGKAAQEAWKEATLRGPFAKWVKEQDLSSLMKSSAAAGNVGVELDIEF